MSRNLFINKLAKKVYELTGNVYSEDRMELFEHKIKEFLKSGGFNTNGAGEVLEEVLKKEELKKEFIDKITVGETFFFRDFGQIKAFRDYVLKKFKGVRVNIASIGCSTGEEVYTLACLLQKEKVQGKIYGFDINEKAIEKAKEGRYSWLKSRKIPEEYITCFHREADGSIRIPENLKSLVEFRKLNLVNERDFEIYEESMDVVFCRHVLIYFDNRAKETALRNIRRMLKIKGYLILAPAEMIPPPMREFFDYEKYDGFFFYRRKA